MNDKQQRNRLRVFRLIVLGGVALVLAAMSIGAELGARHYERTRVTAPDYFPSMYYPHRRLRYGLVPGLDYYGWFKVNSLGFRGREFSPAKTPGVVRIVCLGASTTFDVGSVGPNPPWPEVLETELRKILGTRALEVLNLGIPGSTSLDSLIDLQTRAIAFEPDFVVVYQAHNDFSYSFPAPTQSDLFPQEDRPRGNIRRWLTIHSLLYSKTEGRVTDMFSRVLAAVSFGSKPSGPKPDPRPALDKGLAEYRSNLRAIAAIANENKLELVLPEIVVPFPVEGPAAGCKVCEGLSGAYSGLPIQDIKARYKAYNDSLLELGTRPGTHFIATGDFVPARDENYHDPVHFGPKGSVAMGSHLAEAMAPLVRDLTSKTKAPHEVRD